MSPDAIVTDSSAYLPAFETDWLPIHVIPLHLIWEGRTYIDGVDIQPEDFFRRLKSYPEMPRTSQISLQTFLDLYRRLLDEGNEILSIHISGRVSGTLNTAMQAARELAAGRIQVFDSMSGAAAMAFQVLGAARAAARGAALRGCECIARQVRDSSHTYFIPATLEFLRRGGRIGGAAALLGSALKIHPILETRNGVIEACEKVRTMSRAMLRMAERVEQRVRDCRSVHIASLYADIPEMAQQLLDLVRQRLGSQIRETVLSTISPVLGAHIGPGAVGMAFSCNEE